MDNTNTTPYGTLVWWGTVEKEPAIICTHDKGAYLYVRNNGKWKTRKHLTGDTSYGYARAMLKGLEHTEG